jgi:methionyl-tRNA formyltransferase
MSQPLRVLFAGTPQLAADHLTALIESPHDVVAVVTQPDKPGKRGRQSVPSHTKTRALEASLPVLQPRRLRTDDLTEYPADVLVVVAFGQILRPPVLAFPRCGCINVHASILPRWRGAAPIQRSLAAGDAETGVTIMQMDEGLDTGDILEIRRTRITDHDTAASLSARLSELGQAALLTSLDQLASGNMNPVVQSGPSSYATKIEKAEAQINWASSNTQIDRQIRALNPNPIAFTNKGEMRTRLWHSCTLSEATDQSPGTIVDVTDAAIEVACGAGTVGITQLQIPVGKGKVITARDVLNSRRELFEIGSRFGT